MACLANQYIHANPVRKGLVEYTEQWKWSSAGWYAGKTPNSLKPDPLPFAFNDIPKLTAVQSTLHQGK